MLKLNNPNTVHELSAANEPALYIRSGDTVEIYTKDCFSGLLQYEGNLYSTLPHGVVNPASAPLYVIDSKAGDALKIEVIDISVDSHGVVIREAEDMRRYGVSWPEKSIHLSVTDGGIRLNQYTTLPIEPMIGVIGTAPRIGAVSTLLPGDHGGNMDNACIKKGSVVFLPVFHDGAILSVGDLHASMGDGEPAGCGIEISGRVVLRVTTLKSHALSFPMVESGSSRMTIASGDSLEEASRLAVGRMIQYMEIVLGIDPDLIWSVLAAVGHVSICQYANKLKTVRCEVPVFLIEQLLR